MVLLIITILATSALAGGKEQFDKIFQKFQTSKGLNVQRKDSEKFASNQVGSERDLWVGGGSLQRRGVPPDTSQALQRPEFISQSYKGFGTKEKVFPDSNIIAEEFSESERYRVKEDRSLNQEKQQKNRRKTRVEPNMIDRHQRQQQHQQQHHHQQHQQQVNGERVGERLRGARSAIEANSSPLVGASRRLPIQPNSPPLAGIHTTNGPRVRLSFEQTMAQFGFRPRILQLAKGAGALTLPLSPGKDLVKGKDRSRAPPLTVPIGKGSNNDGRN